MPECFNRGSTLRQAQGDSVMASLSNHGFQLKDCGNDICVILNISHFMKKRFFITLEGPDGCGKTTQSILLAAYFRKKGFDVVHTREPGGTSFAENLRRILLDPKHKILPMAELLLYEASRAQHTDEIIRPALGKGKVVICERYTDATCAYQGYGRKIDLCAIEQLNKIATSGLLPDLTILLDIPVSEGLKRARGERSLGRRREKREGEDRRKSARQTDGKWENGDRLEQENSAFHNRVRKGYFALAKKEPERIKIVYADGTIKQIHKRICEEVTKRLEMCREK